VFFLFVSPESEFIEKIVGDVLKKLHAMSSSHTMTGLFGIDVRVSKVESLLNMESPDVLIIGIWVMGGIGKTTIAEVVRDNIRSRFERIFFANLRQKSDLRRKFLKRLLGQETLNTMGSLSFRDSFVRDRLRRIKVFIVLDDVDDLMRLDEWRDLLDGRNSSFGPGSKVLITSRNKQVLTNVVDQTYKVGGLNYEEAIQLFSSKALKTCIPTIDYRHLIEKIGRHVQGNPLALKVLGSSLYGKSIEEWHSALNKLAQHPQIEKALRISYDGLDSEQKSIFLDIAHFFKGRMLILDCFYGRSVKFDISTLIDKCLISIAKDSLFGDKLEMHDLEFIEELNLSGTAIKEVPSSIQFLTRLIMLDMSGCSELESLPEITVPMKSLLYLIMSKTGIKEIPLISFKHMISLWSLKLDGTPIKVLPELPPSLSRLRTHDCASLETVTSIINIGSLWDFTNCFKLDQKPLVAAMHLKIQVSLLTLTLFLLSFLLASSHFRNATCVLQSGEEIPDGRIQMVLPGSEIPEWFGNKGIGSSLTIRLPSNCHQLKGIAFCLVFLVPLPFYKVYYNYHVKSKNGKHDEVVFASREELTLTDVLVSCDSYHMILHYELELVKHLRKHSGNEVTFKFYHLEEDDCGRKLGRDIRRPFKLKSCGVYLHFDENLLADTDLP
jgi:hypothetical protein